MHLGIFYDGGRQSGFFIMAKRVALLVNQRAIVFDQAFQRFPCEVQTIKGRIAAL